ncbi:MAG: hypothetical protein E7384_08125 [Ruminococcaceae bacterium]|nr:hypothetical protein [Oscillospiraceae bacterium]
MKKFLPVIRILLIIATVLCVVFYVIFAEDFTTYYNSVQDNPASDGIDFFMLGMWHGIILFVLSFVGIVCSVILRFLNSSKFVKIYSIVGIVLFELGLVGAIYVFCI